MEAIYQNAKELFKTKEFEERFLDLVIESLIDKIRNSKFLNLFCINKIDFFVEDLVSWDDFCNNNNCERVPYEYLIIHLQTRNYYRYDIHLYHDDEHNDLININFKKTNSSKEIEKDNIIPFDLLECSEYIKEIIGSYCNNYTKQKNLSSSDILKLINFDNNFLRVNEIFIGKFAEKIHKYLTKIDFY